MTRSPGFHLLTPGPTATTVPASSCPRICGGSTYRWKIFLMSVPQIPHAATLISTTRSPTSGTGTCSTRTIPFSRYTPARMTSGMGPRVLFDSRVARDPLIGRLPRPVLLLGETSHEPATKASEYRLPENERGPRRPFCCPARDESKRVDESDGGQPLE